VDLENVSLKNVSVRFERSSLPSRLVNVALDSGRVQITSASNVLVDGVAITNSQEYGIRVQSSVNVDVMDTVVMGTVGAYSSGFKICSDGKGACAGVNVTNSTAAGGEAFGFDAAAGECGGI
jgi:hypothetical protein